MSRFHRRPVVPLLANPAAKVRGSGEVLAQPAEAVWVRAHGVLPKVFINEVSVLKDHTLLDTVGGAHCEAAALAPPLQLGL